ncbi:MAG: hypothetical protein O7C74_04385 [Acidobacteria bacterium]|nr:hypothetical protein [Acidobacteriota bacterium]MCZ6746434.1 hypothetical protein [Acidobacteriota bacterium]
MSHFMVMALHSLLVATFFAFLTRDRAMGRIRVFVFLFVGMMVGAMALAWVMYPYPVQGRL